jgi:hypothetical protein
VPLLLGRAIECFTVSRVNIKSLQMQSVIECVVIENKKGKNPISLSTMQVIIAEEYMYPLIAPGHFQHVCTLWNFGLWLWLRRLLSLVPQN